MVRDTKLRMSIGSDIIERLQKLGHQCRKASEHKNNAYELRHITLRVDDGHQITFDFSHPNWIVRRHLNRRAGTCWEEVDSTCWEVDAMDVDLVRVSTYGKMCVDINREISELLDQVEVQVNLIEDPIYCPKCEHCGETGCCGYIGFLEKHVRGKTDCIHEDAILDDLIKFLKEEDA